MDYFLRIWYHRGMGKHAYGQQPPDIGGRDLGLGWLAGVRHLKSLSATGSFWHRHREIQLLYCFKGEFSYEFRSLPPEVLTAGHLIVIPAGMEHRHLQAIDPAGHRVEMLIGAVRGAPRRYSLFPPSVAANLIADISGQICTPVACPRELSALFMELDALAESARSRSLPPNDLALARTLSCLILQRCAAQRGASAAPAHRDGARLMDEAVAWLETHYSEQIRMDRLVAYMGYSRSRLFDLFKKHTGLSPADWLARYRIRRARDMLSAGGASVSGVAKACGFASPQYFNAAFKRQTGLTPSSWRTRQRLAAQAAKAE